MVRKALLVGAAMVAAAAFAPSASFGGIIASGSSSAVAPSGFSPVIDFTSPSAGLDKVTITDCCIVGDYYKTWVNGVVVGTTPIVVVEGPTYSSGTFLASLTAGLNNLQVQDLLTLPGGVFPPPASSPILPAGFSWSVSTIPEPSTWAMMGLGFAALAFAGARASRKRMAALG